MGKKKIAVLFGGQSSEHEISCMSVQTIAGAIDKEKYEILLIGITKEGRWVLVDGLEAVKDGSWKDSKTGAVLSPDATQKGIYITKDGETFIEPVDVVFPVLHGRFGEDGTVQGVLELAGIPYVGCGVTASAFSMDNWVTKVIADSIGIRQAAYVPFRREEVEDFEAACRKVEEAFPYPVFVKPANAGSSKGVTKAGNREELIGGIKEAFCHDRKILVEEAIFGHEVECAVLGGYHAEASGVGEILAAAEFYDFEAKYFDEESKTVTDPELPGNAAQVIRKEAVDIFRAVDGFGLARVDFFVKDDGTVIFNELNTMPGFTSISMYPMLWEKQGLSLEKLVDELIELAFKR